MPSFSTILVSLVACSVVSGKSTFFFCSNESLFDTNFFPLFFFHPSCLRITSIANANFPANRRELVGRKATVSRRQNATPAQALADSNILQAAVFVQIAKQLFAAENAIVTNSKFIFPSNRSHDGFRRFSAKGRLCEKDGI